MGGFAWVTLATNDSYSLGALVLAHSLKQSATNHQLAVLVTPGVTKSMRVKLGSVFDVVQEVNILDSKDESNLRLLKRPELGVTFTKLHCWRLTQFEKCVFLDADTLVLKNCDELFERDEFSAAPDVGWPDCFNSGVFVYRPSVETYDKLVQFALEKGSFDGGDQGLLNLYFNDWAHKDISKHLPFIYNMCSTACYSYLPAFKQYGSNVKIVHFISSTKPWLQYFDTESRQVQPAGDMHHLKSVLQCWWDIFCSLIHPNLTSDMSRSTAPNQSNTPLDSPSIIQTPPISAHSDYRNVWDPWEDYDYIETQQPESEPPPYPPHQPAPITATTAVHIPPPVYNHPQISKEEPAFIREPHPLPKPQYSHHNISPEIHQEISKDNHLKDHCQSVNKDNFSEKSDTVMLLPPQDTEHDLNIKSIKVPVYEKHSLTENPPHSPVHSSINVTMDSEVKIACETKDSDKADELDAGLAGAFAQFTLGAPRSPTQTALEDQLRRQGWEVGNIDYMGRDAFDNIWSKICETLSTGTQKAAEPTTTGDVQKTDSIVETAVEVTEKPAEEAKLSEEKTEIKPTETPVVEAEKQQPVEAKPQPVDQKPTEIEGQAKIADIEMPVTAQDAKPIDASKSTEEVKKTEAESQTVEVKPTEIPKPVDTKSIDTAIEEAKPVVTKPADETKPDTPEVQAETPKPAEEKKSEALPEEKTPKATEEVKPVESEKPVTEDKPEMQQQVPESKIKPIVCPKLVEEQKPVEEVKPVEGVKPAEEIKPSGEVKPTEEIKPVEGIKLAEEVKIIEELKPAEIVTPIEEVKPLTGVKPIEEVKPAAEVKLIEEVKSAGEVKPIEEEKPAKTAELGKLSEVKPVKPAEEVKRVEEAKLETKPCEEVKPDCKAKSAETPTGDLKPEEKQAPTTEVKSEEPKKESEEKLAVVAKSEEPAKVESKPEQPQLKPADSKVPEAVPVAQEPKKSKESKCEDKAAQKKEETKSVEVTKVQEKESKTDEACSKKMDETKPAEKKDDSKQEKPKDVKEKGKDEAAKPEVSSTQPTECKKQGKGGKKDKKKQQEAKGECPKSDCPQKECPKSECPKDCPKEKQDCPKKACSKDSKPVETPKTPEVIEATPPTSPIATDKPEEKALGVEGSVPSTPPPPTAAAASGEQQAPTPPPRKSNGGKKAKAKK